MGGQDAELRPEQLGQDRGATYGYGRRGRPVGTDQDPQGLERQEEQLRKLGAVVCASNRMAAEAARAIAEGRDVV